MTKEDFMIDKVRIYKQVELDVTKFDKRFKFKHYIVPAKIDRETGEVLEEPRENEGYFYEHNAIKIIYSEKTHQLMVHGRLPNASGTRNLVHNIDDYIMGQEKIVKYEVYQEERDATWLCENMDYDADDNQIFPDQWIECEDIETVEDDVKSIIENVNRKIYELTKVRMDIREFRVSYIEVTFNIFDVAHVGRYIEMFNLIFDKKDDPRYKNYVREKNLERHTSFYVKSQSNYRDNKNDSYTVNFYNKKNQLEYLEANPKNNSNVTSRDKRLAENVLRLEVQLAYQGIKALGATFKNFLDINVCKDVIISKYRWFISKNEHLDFYSYKAAKQIIIQSELKPRVKSGLLDYIKSKKKYHKNTISKYRNLLASLGIHWCFIPTAWGIDYLESPIKLLNEKVNGIIGSFENWDEYLEWLNEEVKCSEVLTAPKEQEVDVSPF